LASTVPGAADLGFHGERALDCGSGSDAMPGNHSAFARAPRRGVAGRSAGRGDHRRDGVWRRSHAVLPPDLRAR